MAGIGDLTSFLRRGRGLAAALGLVGLAGGVTLGAVQFAWSRYVPATAAVPRAEAVAVAAESGPVAPAWSVVAHAEPLFGMGPGLYPVPVRHEVRRLVDGVTRMDVFSFGNAHGGPFARLVLERMTDASPPEGGLYVTVVRNAAAEGFAVERVSLPTLAESRFGPMETAEVTLTTERGPVECTVFRGVAADGPLRYSGWSCAVPKTAEAARCLVDAATFSTDIHEPAMARVFEAGEDRIAEGCRPQAKPVPMAKSSPAAPEYTSSTKPKSKNRS